MSIYVVVLDQTDDFLVDADSVEVRDAAVIFSRGGDVVACFTLAHVWSVTRNDRMSSDLASLLSAMKTADVAFDDIVAVVKQASLNEAKAA